MKQIFVYGILQKHISASDFGLEDSHYLGRGIVYGWKRESLTYITRGRYSDTVEGDIFEVPEYIEHKLYKFESQFGEIKVVNDAQKAAQPIGFQSAGETTITPAPEEKKAK